MADDALLQTLDSSRYISVIWSPGTNPVTVYYVRLDDAPLAPSNPNDPDSPSVFRIPDSASGHKKLSWLVSPSVDVDKLGIALSSQGSPQPKLIKMTDDPNNCSRGKMWKDDAPLDL
jgi:hypothetical protein